MQCLLLLVLVWVEPVVVERSKGSATAGLGLASASLGLCPVCCFSFFLLSQSSPLSCCCVSLPICCCRRFGRSVAFSLLFVGTTLLGRGGVGKGVQGSPGGGSLAVVLTMSPAFLASPRSLARGADKVRERSPLLWCLLLLLCLLLRRWPVPSSRSSSRSWKSSLSEPACCSPVASAKPRNVLRLLLQRLLLLLLPLLLLLLAVLPLVPLSRRGLCKCVR